MASVHDVAAHILDRMGSMTAMKLQKLVYYSQAWHLVWDEEQLFSERIEAWANGPVAPALFALHRGKFTVDVPWASGSASNLTANEIETVNAIITSYGPKSGRDLSILTHAEMPWRMARVGLAPTAISTNEITLASMADYYGALDADEDARDVSEWELEPMGTTSPF